jgi:protein TonB
VLVAERSPPPTQERFVTDASPTAHNATRANNANEDPAPTAVGDEPDAVDIPQLLTDLRRAVDRHKFYPSLARQRGWQGEVVLAFRIDHTGAIERVRLAQGSGYPVLDKSALEAMRRVGRLDSAAAALPRNVIDLELAVIYRLTDG